MAYGKPDNSDGSGLNKSLYSSPVSSVPPKGDDKRPPLQRDISPTGGMRDSAPRGILPMGDETVDTMALLQEWRTWLQSGFAPKTVQSYWGGVRRFFDKVPRPMAQVQERDVAAFLERYPYRSASRTLHYLSLKSFFGWCLRNGYILDDPMAGIRVPHPTEKETRALTREEYEAVKSAAYARSSVHGAVVEVLYHSGGRITETIQLTWEDISEEGITFRQTKNGKERKVPWTPGLLRAVGTLRSHFGEHSRVIPRSGQTVWLWVRQAGKEAGVEGVHPHLFRATAATSMMNDGAKAHHVQKFLGHSKLTTTQRYLAVTQTDVADAATHLWQDEEVSVSEEDATVRVLFPRGAQMGGGGPGG